MKDRQSKPKKQKLITTSAAVEALMWLEEMSTHGPTHNDQKQAMVVRGLIKGLERCLEVQTHGGLLQ